MLSHSVANSVSIRTSMLYILTHCLDTDTTLQALLAMQEKKSGLAKQALSGGLQEESARLQLEDFVRFFK
jgi:hypothetical protein